MIQNPKESVDALSKLADILGKKTVVLWAIVTTFTTGYLFLDGRKTQETRINEIKQSNERLIEEVKGIKQTAHQTKIQVDSAIPKLDTTISAVNNTLKQIKNKR